MPNAFVRGNGFICTFLSVYRKNYEKNGSIGKYEPFFPLIRYLFASAHLLRGGGGFKLNSGDGWLRARTM